ncbi:mitochondrial 54S ribosomal protein YmL41 [Rhinocladiella similis]
MPRARLPPTLHTKPKLPTTRAAPNAPRLWNAKRRVKTTIGLNPFSATIFKRVEPPLKWLEKYEVQLSSNQPPKQQLAPETLEALRATQTDSELRWWEMDRKHLDHFMDVYPPLSLVSSDVRDFLHSNSKYLSPQKVTQLLQSPSRFFSKPANVPYESRKQINFPHPNDAVVLMRTPHLSPNYAAFDVPLHFSKLDLRAYLRNVYGVEVLHIRSVVIQQKVKRTQPSDRYGQGALYRPPSIKKMTVQLANPFVYPEEIKDLDPWEHDDYWQLAKAQFAQERESSEWGLSKPNLEHRKSIAQQAQELLKGKKKWAPTWQLLDSSADSPSDYVPRR